MAYTTHLNTFTVILLESLWMFMALGFPHHSARIYLPKNPKVGQRTRRNFKGCWTFVSKSCRPEKKYMGEYFSTVSNHRFTQRVVLDGVSLAPRFVEKTKCQFFCNIFSHIITRFVDADHITFFPTKDPLPWDPKASRWNHPPSSMPVPDPTRPASFVQKVSNLIPNITSTQLVSATGFHHPSIDPQRLSFANQIRVSMEYGHPRCGTGVPKLQRTFAVAQASESGLPGAHSTGHLTHTWHGLRRIIVYHHIRVLCIKKSHVYTFYVSMCLCVYALCIYLSIYLPIDLSIYLYL